MRPDSIGIRSPLRWPILVFLLMGPPTWADTVTLKGENGERVQFQCTVLEDAGGVVVVRTRDLQFKVIPRRQIMRVLRGRKVIPYPNHQLVQALEKEFGKDFDVLRSEHYMTVYDCDRKFAEASRDLLEHTYEEFRQYFIRRGSFKLEKLPQPLIAVIYEDQTDFLRETESSPGMAGVYKPLTNRIYMYQKASPRLGSGGNSIDPLAVITHEAVHQISFNTGFHERLYFFLGLYPRWIVEGLAMYFETTSVKSESNWDDAGRVNEFRLLSYALIDELPEGVLDAIVVKDALFTSGNTAGQAYALGWALTYYLAVTDLRDLLRYLHFVNGHEDPRRVTPKRRLNDFKRAFGKYPRELQPQFEEFMAELVSKHTESAGRASKSGPRDRSLPRSRSRRFDFE